MDGRVMRGTAGAGTFALDEERSTGNRIEGFAEADALLFSARRATCSTARRSGGATR